MGQLSCMRWGGEVNAHGFVFFGGIACTSPHRLCLCGASILRTWLRCTVRFSKCSFLPAANLLYGANIGVVEMSSVLVLSYAGQIAEIGLWRFAENVSQRSGLLIWLWFGAWSQRSNRYEWRHFLGLPFAWSIWHFSHVYPVLLRENIQSYDIARRQVNLCLKNNSNYVWSSWLLLVHIVCVPTAPDAGCCLCM